MMLTAKQLKLLKYLNSYIKLNGVSPSFDEMKEAMALKSKSGIHRLITALEEREYLRRLPNRARAIEILKWPENLSQDEPWMGAEAQRSTEPTRDSSAEMISLPLLGKIAAGTPIEAIRDESNFVNIPAGLIGSGNHYALEVQGDSMVNAGIHDGDTVVIQSKNTAYDGDIVVALIDQEEVTLKKFLRDYDKIILQAANPLYQDRVFAENRVQVQGILKTLIRSY